MSSGGDFNGQLKLVDISPNALRLNNTGGDFEALISALTELMDMPTETIVVRSHDVVNVQRLINIYRQPRI